MNPLIHFLPDELVLEVLKHLFNSALSDFEQTKDRHGWKKWIIATHFCRRWRHIAISSPGLWTLIDSGSLPPSAIAEFLARSKTSGIVVFASESPEIPGDERFTSVSATLSMVMPHRHRICCMQYGCTDDGVSALEEFLAKGTLPALTTLAVVVRNGPIPVRVPFVASALPPINANLRALKSLILLGASLPWFPGMFTGLSRLELVLCGAVLLDRLVDALDGCHLLEYLCVDSPKIHGFVIIDPGRLTVPRQHVQLNSLTELHIRHLSVALTVHLIDHLTFPPSCIIEIYAKSPGSPEIFGRGAVAILSSHRTWFSPITCPGGRLFWHVTSNVGMISNEWQEHGAPRRTRLLHMSVDDTAHEDLVIPAFVHPCLASLDSDSIRDLHISMETEDHRIWAEIFRYLHKLTSLSLFPPTDFSSSRTLGAPFLALAEEDVDHAGGTSIRCLHLKEFRLFVQDSFNSSALVSCLRFRKSRGATLMSLAILGSSVIHYGSVHDLEELVETLECNLTEAEFERDHRGDLAHRACNFPS
jgi:hypothetical protein